MPHSPYVGIPKKENKKLCLFCILGYSRHIIFSWKSPIFLVIGDFYVIFNVIFGDFLVSHILPVFFGRRPLFGSSVCWRDLEAEQWSRSWGQSSPVIGWRQTHNNCDNANYRGGTILKIKFSDEKMGRQGIARHLVLMWFVQIASRFSKN